ncbi:MAG: hypothetical protein HYS32_01090 [Candidatus Woesearchaeota archaeon]|nr:MAG: hypothetical protein HYS32_01090 [Candidatus Woesearchaeota archaeon]
MAEKKSDKKVVWKDPQTGKNYGIAYSTEVQEKLLRALEANVDWRRKTYYVLEWIRWLVVLGIVLAIILLTYLNSRNAITAIGQRLFCGS